MGLSTRGAWIMMTDGRERSDAGGTELIMSASGMPATTDAVSACGRAERR